jgi:hypothetical protein
MSRKRPKSQIVIAGLDPAIHLLRKMLLVAKTMDPRVKPAGDDGEPLRPTLISA